MVSLAIDVQDMANVHNLLFVPSPRRVPTAREMAAFVARLAPIEMATPSISSTSSKQQINNPLLPSRAQQSASSSSCCQAAEELGPAKPVSIPGWAVPLGYLSCGLTLFLCGLLVPDGLVPCAHILTPVWTLTLAAHALALGNLVWAWLGLLVACLLPFVLLLRDVLFLGFYLLLLAVFGTGRFWHALSGPQFVLVCACWLGLGASCVLALLADHPRAQLTVAAFFALASAVVASSARLGGLVLRAG